MRLGSVSIGLLISVVLSLASLRITQTTEGVRVCASMDVSLII
ncbi:unnamed protein product [Amoebophrya sp. A25]|nr:unnamed protein product [Amoebophrya sp. A25]|eukprot:GSA25T00025611001.1